MTIVALLIGLAAGAAVAWLALRSRLADAPALRAERDAALAARDGASERVIGLERDLAGAAARLEASEGSLEARVRDAIRSASAEAYAQSNASFLELAGAKLGETVAPLRQSLDKVNAQVQELDRQRAQSYGALARQVGDLGERTQALATALRTPHVRGRWGEMQLKRVVEMAQMLEYCDFVQQETRGNEDTGRLRPDLVVRLPGGKQVVVDAKTPLAAYIDAIEAPDEATQQARLADHARQVRDHMTALGRKAYWDQFQPSPEFVVMFLPGEMFFSAALQQDPSLIESGVAEKVIPATPTTLIALLRAVAYGWRQEALAKNAQEVADLGKQLYERIATMTDHWSSVGDRLGQAVKSYNDAVASLESRVLVSARKLRDLKAGAEDVEIKSIEPVERTPRKLLAVPTLPKPGNE